MLKKIALIIFAATLALSFAACDIQETAFSSDDVQVSSGLYMYYMFSAYMEAANKQTDTTVDLLKTTIEDTSAKDWIKNKAKDYATEYITIEKKFAELELAFTEEELSSIPQNASMQYQQYQQYYAMNGISERSYYAYAKNLSKKQKVFESIYAEDGTKAIAEDELKKFFSEKYALTTEFSFAKTDDEGNLLDEAKKAEVKTKAEGYAKRIRDGENIEKIIVEQRNEKAKAEAEAAGTEAPPAEEVDEDANSSIVISNIEVSEDEPVSQKITNIFEKVAIGTIGVVEDDDAYYVVKRDDILKAEGKYDENKNKVMYDIKGDEFEETVKSWGAEVKIKTDNRIIKKYSADKIKTNDPQAQY